MWLMNFYLLRLIEQKSSQEIHEVKINEEMCIFYILSLLRVHGKF